MKRSFSLCLIAIFVFIVGKAQTFPTDTLAVLQIAQEEGLSQLGASSLQFDKQGYLWAGTQNGLNRFNGYQMKVWLSDINNSGFPDDHIRGMHYQQDTLWMTTNTHSLCAYLLKENRFIHFSKELDFEKNPFVKYSYAISATPNNQIIIGTAGHCILYDRNLRIFDILPVPQILENDFVTDIQHFKKNHYLIGTNASGLYILDIQHKTIVQTPILRSFQNNLVDALYKLDNGDILVGTANGMYLLADNLKTLHKIGQRNVRSIHRWDEEHLLIGGKNENFLLAEDFTWRKLVFVNHDGKELTSDILAYQEDVQGGKWLGTETRGILYYHPNQMKFTSKRIQAANAPKQDFISTFNFLRDGNDLWMATEFGFVKHPLTSDRYKLYRTDLLEYTLTKDARGTIWAGGFEQGLLRYDRQKDKFASIPLPFLDKDIIQITPISSDSIWIHTWSSGIYSMHTGTLKMQPVKLLGKELVRSRTSLVDRQGNIWIGSDEGLYQVKKNRNVKYYDSLSNERVFAIAEDLRGKIWIGTAKGVNQVDPKTGITTHYTQQTGLPNDFIYGLLVDQKNNVWMSTNYGISMFNQYTAIFKNYTEDDGLQNDEFNGKAAYQDSLGYFYFGGMNGFNVFHPDSIPMNTHTGKTHIENVLLFGRPIQENILYTDTLTFSHDQNVITFDFVNLNYLWSKKNRYQFILEGFDKEWRPITRDRSTTYTNLAPGTYTFKVRGSNNELIWGDIDEMTIIIRSPWYATLPFRVGLILLISALVVGGFSYKTYQQKLTNRRLLQMVNERTEELSKTNKVLHESLSLTQQQKDNITFLMQELNHRVKNNLQLITSLIDIQSFQIDNQRIQKKLRTLQARVFTVSRIHDLLNLSDNDKGVSIKSFINNLTADLITFSGQKIYFHSNISDLVLPSNKLTYLGLILNELIINSIKHAFKQEQEHKEIHVSLAESGNNITIQYSDNGVGFDKSRPFTDDHKGMGLMRLLIKELKGTMDIEVSNGSIFTIKLPKT